VRGVSDRVDEIADFAEAKSPAHRPPYRHQVPLQFVPGVGQARIAALIQAFGSEMAVLHRATRDQLANVAGQRIADRIVAAREGKLAIEAGGGGTYGRTLSD
jgi:PHP family Zn ribbon phosphoesterase